MDLIKRDKIAKQIEYLNMIEDENDFLVQVNQTQNSSYHVYLPSINFNKIINQKENTYYLTKRIKEILLEESSNFEIRYKTIKNELLEELLGDVILSYISDKKLLPLELKSINGDLDYYYNANGLYHLITYHTSIDDGYDPEGKWIGYSVDLYIATTQVVQDKSHDIKKEKPKSQYLSIEDLKLNLMMYGKTRRERLVYDEDGEKIITGYTKSGNPKYKKERYNVILKPGKDKGIYPSVNRIYAKHGIYSNQAREKIDEWRQDAQEWALKNNWNVIPKDVKVYADYYFVMPNDNRSRDTHNIFKMNLDALEGIIYENDKDVLVRTQGMRKANKDEIPHILINFKLVNEKQ